MYLCTDERDNVQMKQLSLFPDDFFEDNDTASNNSTMQNKHSYKADYLFERLAKSPFRSKFRLSKKDADYINDKGLGIIRKHAMDFVSKRLTPAVIANDGKQTPMRGHPVFIAQHATACCCRGCLNKWHHIAPGRQLTENEQHYVVDIIMEWIGRQLKMQ